MITVLLTVQVNAECILQVKNKKYGIGCNKYYILYCIDCDREEKTMKFIIKPKSQVKWMCYCSDCNVCENCGYCSVYRD